MESISSIGAVATYSTLAQVLAMQQLSYTPRTINATVPESVSGFRTRIGTPRISSLGRTDLYL